MARRSFESVVHREDGSFVLVSSALTGNFWTGTLWVFGSVEEYKQCPNLDMVATRTSTGITDAVWLPDNKGVLLSTDSGELELWLCHPPGCTLENQFTVGSHDDMALCVGCLFGGDKAVSGGADRSVIVWDLTKEVELKSYKAHADTVIGLATHKSSEFCVATSSQDGTIKVWDFRQSDKPATQVPSVSSRDKIYTSLTWSLIEEHSLAIGSEGGEVEVVDLRGAGVVLSYQSHTRAVRRLAYSPQEPSLLASASDDSTMAIYSLHSSSNVLLSTEHTDFVRGLSWHPSGSHLLTCGWDGQILQHLVDRTACNGREDMAIEEALEA